MNTSALTPNTEPDRPPLAVIKVGGAALAGGADARALAADLLEAMAAGWRLVVVHGGGAELSALTRGLNIETKFVEGLRITDDATLAAAIMAFMSVNVRLTAAFTAAALAAAGLAGSAAGLLQVTRRRQPGINGGPALDLGWVGDVISVDTRPITGLWSSGCLPVIAPLGIDEQGHIYNVNADTAAAAIAAGIGADQLLLLTDVPGVLHIADHTVVRRLTYDQVGDWLKTGKAGGGMMPKLTAATRAAGDGVGQVRIVDGRHPGVVSRHLVHGADDGTVIIGREAS